MNQRLLSSEGPAEETMNDKPKEKYRRNSNCCHSRLFERPDDDYTLMKETKSTQLTTFVAGPVSQNMESKRKPKPKDEDCCSAMIYSKENSFPHRRGGGSVKKYPGFSNRDYEKNKGEQKEQNSGKSEIKPTNHSDSNKQTNHSVGFFIPDEATHQDTISSTEYHQLNSADVGGHDTGNQDAGGLDKGHHI